MPKYVLASGQRANFLKGRKTTVINGVTVEFVEDILFKEGEVVDTGDFSLQSFVDIGVVDEIMDRIETGKPEDAVSVMTEIEDVKPDTVFVGVVDVQEDKTVESEVVISDVNGEVIEGVDTDDVFPEVETESVDVSASTKKRGRPRNGAKK